GAGGHVQVAFDHQRRALELVLGLCAEIVGLEAPGDFELVKVGGVDLVERRILAALQIGRVIRPFAVLGGWLLAPRRQRHRNQRNWEHYEVMKCAPMHLPLQQLLRSLTVAVLCFDYFTETFTNALVQQQTNPPPPRPLQSFATRYRVYSP